MLHQQHIETVGFTAKIRGTCHSTSSNESAYSYHCISIAPATSVLQAGIFFSLYNSIESIVVSTKITSPLHPCCALCRFLLFQGCIGIICQGPSSSAIEGVRDVIMLGCMYTVYRGALSSRLGCYLHHSRCLCLVIRATLPWTILSYVPTGVGGIIDHIVR